MKNRISIIVAAAENGVIGDKGGIPWRIVDDMRFFKDTTKGHQIIMGRTTYETLGKPLPDRQNIVLTSKPYYTALGCIVVHSLEAALAEITGAQEAFIIGGGGLYKDALERHIVDRIYLTRVHASPNGDTTFSFDEQDWTRVSSEPHEASEKNQYPFSFEVYDRAN